jgi:hypothetical protein
LPLHTQKQKGPSRGERSAWPSKTDGEQERIALRVTGENSSAMAKKQGQITPYWDAI